MCAFFYISVLHSKPPDVPRREDYLFSYHIRHNVSNSWRWWVGEERGGKGGWIRILMGWLGRAKWDGCSAVCVGNWDWMEWREQ